MKLFKRKRKKQLLAELAELHRQCDEARIEAASVAHDMNGLLGAIMCSIQLAQKGVNAETSLANALKSTNRIAAMVEALIKFAKTGSEPLKLEPIDPRELLEEVRDELKAQIPDGVEMIFGILPSIVMADRLQLYRIFLNLIANAIKFRKPHEPLRICISGLEQDGEVWVFSVKDNGIGISEKELEKIFMPLHRIDKDADGIGMGLASCKKFVELHGGRIWAESDGPRMGSTLKFTVPVPKGEE